MNKKYLVIGGAVILLIAGIIAVRRSATKSTADQIKTVPATEKTFSKSVQSSGKTKADVSATLRFQTSGTLAYILYKEGDSVKKGHVIAKLDTANLEATVRQEEQDFIAAKAASEKLYNAQGAKTAESYDEKVNRTAVDATQNKAYDALVKARKDLADATLVSPIDGVITHVDAPVAGVNVTPATATITIVDPSSLLFEANVDEVDVGSLSVGQAATITLDAFPSATFSGVISYIAFSSVLSAGGATVFPVQVTFTNPQNIRVGLNGDVTIETTAIPKALVVPIEAIREQAAGKFVYKKTGKTYTLTRVTTGEQSDSEVVITGGLSPGDNVVIKGFSQMPKNK